jgi:GNAT acetyltransferase-like protein
MRGLKVHAMARTTNGGTEFDPAALERTEARFWREAWDAAPPAVAVAKGMRRAEFGPVQATVIAALPEVRMLNLMLGAASADAAAEGFVEDAVDWIREQGARGFALLDPNLPGAQAAEATLTAAGYEKGHDWMRFVRDPHPPRFKVAGDVEVVELDGSEEDAPFGAIAALSFGLPSWVASLLAPVPALPDWRCYLARLDGEPVACAAMLLDGEVAELGWGATLEGGRRRGCQLALLGRRIEDAAAAGVRTLFVETGARVPGHPSTSYANILRAAFEEAYLCPGWIDARPAAG